MSCAFRDRESVTGEDDFPLEGIVRREGEGAEVLLRVKG